MILKDARITILVSQDSTKIELYDYIAGVTFAEIELTPQQLSQALSRLGYTQCKAKVTALDRLNKLHENKNHEFEIPENCSFYDKTIETVKELAKATCPDGWIPDLYFGSQNSFFKQDGKNMARCVIRRWVEIPYEPQSL